MYPRPLVAACALAAALTLTACGGSGDTKADETPATTPTPTATESASPTPSPTPEAPQGTTVEVTIKGDTMTPNAEKVKVKRGEDVTVSITSDREGELHVHSTPDKHVPFKAGETSVTMSFDRPGLIDVEEHESGKLLVQFEVR